MRPFAFLASSILTVAVFGPAPATASDLAVVGTGDGIEMLRAVGDAFNARHADPKVVVPPSIGSGGAVAAVGSDRERLGRVARALSEAEKSQGLREVPLVKIPSAIFAHPGNGVRGLTARQLADVFAGRIENWQELGGADLRIRVVRRENTDSTLTVLRATMPGWKDLELTARSKTATTTQEAVEAVKRVPGAIGFGPYSKELNQGSVVLSIDGKAPQDAAYPSTVTLSLIYKEATLDAEARAFLSFAESDTARQVLLADGGIPLGR